MRPVWMAGSVSINQCPKSAASGEVLRLIEEFSVWKMIGRVDYRTLPAKTVDAFVVLEREWRNSLDEQLRTR